MVTRPSTRPAPLTQRQVDELAGGRHAGVASMLHHARAEPPASARTAAIGSSSPVAVSASELASIARGGAVPAVVAKRISASPALAGGNGKPKKRATSRPAQATTSAGEAGSKPSLEPPTSSAEN